LKPYGRLNLRTVYYQLPDEGSSKYDWYDVHVRQQSVPGKELGWSEWRVSDIYTWIDADYYNPEGFLSDYGPSTSYGPINRVSITFHSWSYQIPKTCTCDESDFSLELAKWHYDVNERDAGLQT
jgi:hypothetical protein